MYTFDGKNWVQKYKKSISEENRQKIKNAFEQVGKEVDFLPKKHYGETIEDLGTEITFSAWGQKAPIEVKKDWDTDNAKRQELRKLLEKYIPEFDI